MSLADRGARGIGLESASAVSSGDLRLTRLLTSIRALPARLPSGHMPREREPLLPGCSM